MAGEERKMETLGQLSLPQSLEERPSKSWAQNKAEPCLHARVLSAWGWQGHI